MLKLMDKKRVSILLSRILFILLYKDTLFILTLCIPETPKQVLLQTVKTQMKCSISSGSTLIVKVKNLQTKVYNIFWKL